MIYFISGHRNLPYEDFEKYYIPKIREVLENDPWAEFVVGDCNGVDKYAMDYIYNKTGRKLTIYHMFKSPRNIPEGYEPPIGIEEMLDCSVSVISGFKSDEENPSISGQMVYKLSNFDPEAIERLNKIFKETGCKLIVSSSWRFDSDLKELFKMVGISNEIFGITGISQTRYRGFEIQNYLDAQKNVLSYCILDDNCDMLPTQLDNFIQTDFRVGLTEDNVNKAIKILNRYDEH